MKIIHLDHVALIVSNVIASASFYQTVLCLPKMKRPAFDFNGAWFRLGTKQELHLIEGVPVNDSSARRQNHFALQVDDIFEWAQHLEKMRITFRGPKKRPDGAYQIFLADPDEHQLELYQKHDIIM